MTTIRNWVSSRLVNKLILLFTSIIILVVGSLTVVSYQMLRKESVHNSMSSTANNLLLVNRNLENYLEGIEQLSLPQLRYDEIVGAITHEEKDYVSRLYLENYLRTLFFSRPDMEMICLYLVDQNKYYLVSRENYNVTVRTRVDPDLPKQAWYKSVMAAGDNRLYQSLLLPGAETGYPMPSGGSSMMAFHRVLRAISTREPQAVMSFYLNQSGIQNITKDVPFRQGEHLVFLSPDNVPFYSDDLSVYTKLREDGLFRRLSEQTGEPLSWTEGGERYLVVYDVAAQKQWKLVKPIPYREIYEAANVTRNWSYVIGFLFLLLAVVLVTLISNAITKPLKSLSHQMGRFSAGTFHAEVEVVGKDEIAFLARRFNQMVKNTDELINERYKMQLVEKNAILKALEAEINPHFLYNALQAISTMALRHERFDIAEMVDALAFTLRYCISGKDRVPAREELKHIGHYMALQKARFGSRLQLQVEWDESLMELEIPKLSIQSLVENAIKHGVEKVSTAITISIRAELGAEHAVIAVHDNGPGITEQRVEQVKRSFRSDWESREANNIGLVNLHTRLKLLYGADAELEIQSDASGTELRMIIPRGGGSLV